ncbi:hypothetical protein [Halapricum desulfuricans]|uniref:Transcriptional activator TenA n=1 Tax=Halapricum desulfuricans TaxID=2841257 RepID=A0A897MWP4_9EURY|nr:hypothetical protein [Halapricum desulfuricans]QSG05012.1 Transcriptional activator TenA [Halapricum desulfuricans]
MCTAEAGSFADLDRYRRLFETSAQFESLFRDAAWNGEERPL